MSEVNLLKCRFCGLEVRSLWEHYADFMDTCGEFASISLSTGEDPSPEFIRKTREKLRGLPAGNSVEGYSEPRDGR